MSGQLALAISTERVVRLHPPRISACRRAGERLAAATWETLPPQAQREVALALARLAARLIEAERDE